MSTSDLWATYCSQADAVARGELVTALGSSWDREPLALDFLIRALGDAGACREVPSLGGNAHVVTVGERACAQLVRHPALSLPAAAMLLEATEASEARLPASPHYRRPTALQHAIEVLHRCRHRAAPYVPSVVNAFTSDDPLLQAVAAQCLGAIAAHAPEGRAVILACFTNSDARLWPAALLAAHQLQPDDAVGFGPHAAALLDDDRPRVVILAARLLGSLGSRAAPWLGELGAALARNDRETSPALLDALALIGECDQRCLEALVALLEGAGEDARSGATRVLEALGKKALPIAPRLRAQLETARGPHAFLLKRALTAIATE